MARCKKGPKQFVDRNSRDEVVYILLTIVGIAAASDSRNHLIILFKVYWSHSHGMNIVCYSIRKYIVRQMISIHQYPDF